MNQDLTVLVLGASGMLGNTVLRYFSQSSGYSVVGSMRSSEAMKFLPKSLQERIVTGLEIDNVDYLLQLLATVRPDVVINCIGVIKQLAISENALAVIPVNSLLPHRLLQICKSAKARLVHVSTDCVFSGTRGMYCEEDVPDARDLYGRSKLLGELNEWPAVTLRTSIIGPELNGTNGLLGWFLSQHGCVRGFTRAIFSGLPTVELARVIRDFVIPRADLSGIYHVSSDPISKCDLLSIIARVYGVATSIERNDELVVNRSLNSERFQQSTGYVSPTWPDLVQTMRAFG